MFRRLSLAVLFPLGIVFLSLPDLAGQTPAQKTVLLNVSKGQIPSDTGMDDKTIPEIVDDFKELGGKAARRLHSPKATVLVLNPVRARIGKSSSLCVSMLSTLPKWTLISKWRLFMHARPAIRRV